MCVSSDYFASYQKQMVDEMCVRACSPACREVVCVRENECVGVGGEGGSCVCVCDEKQYSLEDVDDGPRFEEWTPQTKQRGEALSLSLSDTHNTHIHLRAYMPAQATATLQPGPAGLAGRAKVREREREAEEKMRKGVATNAKDGGGR